MHALLAAGAMHAHLIENGLRCQCNLLVETATRARCRISSPA